MKKSKIFVVLMLTALAVVTFTNIYADISTSFPEEDVTGITNVNNGAKRIWKTVTFIVQMVAFGAVIFAGVRYMLASADQKADIKKSLAALVLGAILVFAASTVVQFVTTAGKAVMTTTETETKTQ